MLSLYVHLAMLQPVSLVIHSAVCVILLACLDCALSGLAQPAPNFVNHGEKQKPKSQKTSNRKNIKIDPIRFATMVLGSQHDTCLQQGEPKNKTKPQSMQWCKDECNKNLHKQPLLTGGGRWRTCHKTQTSLAHPAPE